MHNRVLLPALVVILVALLGHTHALIILTQNEGTGKLIRSKCQPESGVSTVPKGNFPDDKNLKMRDDKLRIDIAKIMTERAVPEPNRSRILAAIDKCQNADQGLTDPCEIAFAATKCIHDADSEVLLFP
ncbi:hypothetical protein C0J52_05148 [Blattella germanica]|nr:hypothetical protein C0J52_05148 [Blattella germanica]